MPSDRPEVEQYAAALVALGQAGGVLPAIERDLDAVVAFLRKEHGIRRFASDPGIQVEGKCRALEELLADRAHPLLLRFLQILLEQQAFRHLTPIAESFFEQASALRAEGDGELVSAVPLPEDKVAVIESEIGRILDRRVRLRQRVDPSIMGGLRAQVGDFVLDGTLGRQFETIRQTLLREGGDA
jgi:ATP synthase F1 delta subunit